MDSKRIILYVIVALLGVSLYNAWIRDYPPAHLKHPSTTEQAPSSQEGTNYAPTTFTPATAAKTKAAGTAVVSDKESSKQVVEVKTDVLDVSIDLHGVNIVSAKLPEYPVSL